MSSGHDQAWQSQGYRDSQRRFHGTTLRLATLELNSGRVGNGMYRLVFSRRRLNSSRVGNGGHTRAFYAEAPGDLGLSGLGDTVNVAEKKRHCDEGLTTNETLAPVRLYDQLCLRERSSAHHTQPFPPQW